MAALIIGEAVQARPACVPYTVAAEMLTTKHKERLVITGAWQGGAHIKLWRTADGSIDASEKTSAMAATTMVISDAALADDAEITIDIDATGTGAAGAKIYLIGTKT